MGRIANPLRKLRGFESHRGLLEVGMNLPDPPRNTPMGCVSLPPFRVQGVSIAGEETAVQVPVQVGVPMVTPVKPDVPLHPVDV